MDHVSDSSTDKFAPTIQVDFPGFKMLVRQFLEAASTADRPALDAGFRCLSLAYLGLDLPEDAPERVMAVAAYEYASRKCFERERQLIAQELNFRPQRGQDHEQCN